MFVIIDLNMSKQDSIHGWMDGWMDGTQFQKSSDAVQNVNKNRKW